MAIVLSLLGTALSFACLAGYERFATQRVMPGRIPARVAWQVGAMTHAVSNTLGFHALTGGALRYHLYRRLGLGVADVARVVAVVAMCVGTGVVLVTLIALLRVQFESGGLARTIILAAALSLPGLLLLVRTKRVGAEADSMLSTLGCSGGLLLLALVEMMAAIGALYILFPAGVAPPLAQFALVYVGAMLLGIVSHAPGGIGVFETAMLAAVGTDHGSSVLVALLLYRALYNLLPFAVAMTALLLGSLRAQLPERSIGWRI
jgi:uncharacterized membrane protein YbhN (UPF0104 family)